MEEDKEKSNQEDFANLFKMFEGNPEVLNALGDLAGDKEKIDKAMKSWAGYEQFKNNAELLNWAVRKKFETLSTVSALAATLLIVATFNDSLIVLDNFVRSLLTVLLILIPSSLWLLYYESGKTVESSLKKIYSIIEDISGKEAVNKVKNTIKPSFRGAIPLIVNGIFSIIVLLIIFLIWREQIAAILDSLICK